MLRLIVILSNWKLARDWARQAKRATKEIQERAAMMRREEP